MRAIQPSLNFAFADAADWLIDGKAIISFGLIAADKPPKCIG